MENTDTPTVTANGRGKKVTDMPVPLKKQDMSPEQWDSLQAKRKLERIKRDETGPKAQPRDTARKQGVMRVLVDVQPVQLSQIPLGQCFSEYSDGSSWEVKVQPRKVLNPVTGAKRELTGGSVYRVQLSTVFEFNS